MGRPWCFLLRRWFNDESLLLLQQVLSNQVLVALRRHWLLGHDLEMGIARRGVTVWRPCHNMFIRRSPSDRKSRIRVETFGRAGVTVWRPCHNMIVVQVSRSGDRATT
jgi:hypothetical protein